MEDDVGRRRRPLCYRLAGKPSDHRDGSQLFLSVLFYTEPSDLISLPSTVFQFIVRHCAARGRKQCMIPRKCLHKGRGEACSRASFRENQCRSLGMKKEEIALFLHIRWRYGERGKKDRRTREHCRTEQSEIQRAKVKRIKADATCKTVLRFLVPRSFSVSGFGFPARSSSSSSSCQVSILRALFLCLGPLLFLYLIWFKVLRVRDYKRRDETKDRPPSL